MVTKQPYQYIIGIDTGTQTGIAIYDRQLKKLTTVKTVKIHLAMDIVMMVHRQNEGKVFVRVEDARMATFGRANDIHKAQGAGSVKRDAAIWDDFLKDSGIPYQMCRPNKQLTKLSEKTFKQITGYDGLNSSHARDAAMLVWQY